MPLARIAAFLILCIIFQMVQRLLIFSRQRRRFIASSAVIFPFFITPSISVSQFASSRPRLSLPFGDHFIIRLCHLLSSMRTTCSYHFNICFPVYPKIFVLPPFFSVNPYFLLLIFWRTWQILSKILMFC